MTKLNKLGTLSQNWVILTESNYVGDNRVRCFDRRDNTSKRHQNSEGMGESTGSLLGTVQRT